MAEIETAADAAVETEIEVDEAADLAAETAEIGAIEAEIEEIEAEIAVVEIDPTNLDIRMQVLPRR